MHVKYFKVLLLLILEVVLSTTQNTSEMSVSERGESSRILSRRKRYLIFPDGSSFQMVFCTQNQGYLQVGDIVWFGTTAALAWELPTEPKFFNFFKKHDKLHTAQNRDGVSKLIYFLDENGKVLSKMPYRKKPIVNPAFAKRSVDDHLKPDFGNETIQVLHGRHKNINLFDADSNIEFHRQSRKSLYVQLEKFIQALGWQGRECVLRALCEARSGKEQGEFLEEILKATFTLPGGREFDSDLHKEYDEAHKAERNCDILYPKCVKLSQ